MAKTQKNTEIENSETMLTISNTFTEVFKTREVSEENPKIRHTTTTDMAKLFNALNGGSKKVKDYIGTSVNVVDIVITSADVNKDINDKSENPEKHNKAVVHFFTDLGDHISTISNGIGKSVNALLSCGIVPTAENPITIKFTTVDTKNGTAHSFELV